MPINTPHIHMLEAPHSKDMVALKGQVGNEILTKKIISNCSTTTAVMNVAQFQSISNYRPGTLRLSKHYGSA